MLSANIKKFKTLYDMGASIAENTSEPENKFIDYALPAGTCKIGDVIKIEVFGYWYFTVESACFGEMWFYTPTYLDNYYTIAPEIVPIDTEPCYVFIKSIYEIKVNSDTEIEVCNMLIWEESGESYVDDFFIGNSLGVISIPSLNTNSFDLSMVANMDSDWQAGDNFRIQNAKITLLRG